MVVDGEGVPFSVVYSDGVTEATVGEFTVDASFNFNKFLSFLSQKIGISPHNFSVYLATLGTNRKIPITAKVNVAAIVAADRAAAASSFFFVKRARRPRRSRGRNRGSRNGGANNNSNSNNSPAANVVLLRRNDAVSFSGLDATVSVLDRVEYEKRLRELQKEKERFMMKMATGGGAVCEECSAGRDGGFHWCVYDAVTVGFRSPAGPVARPVRGSG